MTPRQFGGKIRNINRSRAANTGLSITSFTPTEVGADGLITGKVNGGDQRFRDLGFYSVDQGGATVGVANADGVGFVV